MKTNSTYIQEKFRCSILLNIINYVSSLSGKDKLILNDSYFWASESTVKVDHSPQMMDGEPFPTASALIEYSFDVVIMCNASFPAKHREFQWLRK